MTCKIPLLRATTSQTGPGSQAKLPATKSRPYYTSTFSTHVQVILFGPQQGQQDRRKVNPSHHLDEIDFR